MQEDHKPDPKEVEALKEQVSSASVELLAFWKPFPDGILIRR
jgi:hypothetical protein